MLHEHDSMQVRPTAGETRFICGWKEECQSQSRVLFSVKGLLYDALCPQVF